METTGRVQGWEPHDPVAHEFLRLMDKILHDLKDPKVWELWYTPYYG